MTVAMRTPDVHELVALADVLSSWQYDDGPLHLHPGDLGWYSMRGAAATAAALRVWSRPEGVIAMGLLDGPGLLRMALDPDARQDHQLAQQIAADVSDPQRGILGDGDAVIEARGADCLSQVLAADGWLPDEPWTPLHRDLALPNPLDMERMLKSGLRIETIGPDQANAWLAVHWSAFRGTEFGEDEQRTFGQAWLSMVQGPLYHRARSLAVFDEQDSAVAVTTVWSAGPGRPGLLEPMGVHRDHRGKGYGTAISIAAATALQEMCASSAIVCAESSNVGAVSTYLAAGFTAREQVADLMRPA